MITEQQKKFYDWIVYQIYPKSFMDSNGDGSGDLNGIRRKLDYLAELGVNAVWLSPCYKSPLEDNGYDISDYYDILDGFGTLDDWKLMIDEMHERGIRLIMDFVPNHTSSEHKWFKEAVKSKNNPYRDFYYWCDRPVNNWKSAFGGSAWEYDERTNQYYLHSYGKGQPDLNWDNPRVREEMRRVVDFWVDLGVDGFRCDVMDQIAKDFENDMNGNAPKLHDYLRELFGRKEVSHIFTVGECWGAGSDNIYDRISGERRELSTLFQMEHMCVGYAKSKFIPAEFKLSQVRDVFIKWQNFMQDKELLATLFFENHDQPRCVSKYGNENEYRYESATMLATLILLQKGVPFIYQGQEIGMVNGHCDNISEYRDIEIINFYNDNPYGLSELELMRGINASGRDNARKPMAWNDGQNGGFTSGTPWMGLCDRYKEINVETDRQSEKSVFNFYKRMIALRKENEEFKRGRYEDMTGQHSGMYIFRRYTEEKSFVVICNFKDESILKDKIDGEIILSNYDRNTVEGVYRPYETVVIEESIPI